jgi:hypothetical protein
MNALDPILTCITCLWIRKALLHATMASSEKKLIFHGSADTVPARLA